MNKAIIGLGLAAITVAIGVANQDSLTEKYLQNKLNANLKVTSGVVSYCGHESRTDEPPEQLVSRVTSEFNGPKTLRTIFDIADKTFKDTAEIETINKKINDWGWESEEYLSERIEFYEGKPHFKDSLDEYLTLREFRKNANYSKEELISKRKLLRHEVYLAKKDLFEEKAIVIFDQVACEINDYSIKQEANVLLAHFNTSKSPQEAELLEAKSEARVKVAAEIAIKPLEAFTRKFSQFMNDAVIELKILDSATTLKDDSITNILTVASQNTFGKKYLLEIGCEASISKLHPSFGSAVMTSCFKRSVGKSDDQTVYLYALSIFAEEFNNGESWSLVQNKLIEEFN